MFENTHEAIVDAALWERAQQVLHKRSPQQQRTQADTMLSVLSSLVYCADCGKRMYCERVSAQGKSGQRHEVTRFRCASHAISRHWEHSLCSANQIAQSVLLPLVQEMIRSVSQFAISDEIAFRHVVADVGNGTMNLLYLRNGRPDESRCWTEKQGVGQCVGMVSKSMMDKYGIQMDEAVVGQVLRTGAGDMQEKYLNCILQVAHRYVNRIFDTLRAHGYDPRIMRLWIVGGGGCLVRNFGTYDASRAIILDDLCATAKGYEYLAYGQMLRKGCA